MWKGLHGKTKNIKTIERTQKIILYILLTIMAIAVITPFYWMIASSFKPEGEITSPNPKVLPSQIVLENYFSLFTSTFFVRWLGNSLIVSCSITVIGLFFCSLGGFGFAKYRFAGRDPLFLVILGSATIPLMVTIVPVFAWAAKLHLLNTYFILIFPFTANAFGLFFMRQYISSIPDEIIDSCRIDGCSEFRIYWQMILPVIKPALGALSIMLFLSAWGSYLWPLIMTMSNEMFTLQVGLATMYGSMHKVEYGVLMGGATIATLPVLILFLSAQRQFIAGLTYGATKG